MLCSLAAWIAVTFLPAAVLRPWDPATSYRRPWFAEPQADYLEVSHPRLKTHCCRQEEPTATPSEKRNGIPALMLLVATGWESWTISFARSTAEAPPRVAWIGADDELLLAASDNNAETRSAVSAWVAALLFRLLIRLNTRWKTRSRERAASINNSKSQL